MSDEESMKPRFDATINFGHMLSLSGVIVAIIAGYFTFDSRLTILEKQLTRITAVLELSIRQDEQLKGLLNRVDRLENGRQR